MKHKRKLFTPEKERLGVSCIGTQNTVFLTGRKLAHTSLNNMMFGINETLKAKEKRKDGVEYLDKLMEDNVRIIFPIRHPIDKWISGYLEDLRLSLKVVDDSLPNRLRHDILTEENIQSIKNVHNSSWVWSGEHSNFFSYNNGFVARHNPYDNEWVRVNMGAHDSGINLIKLYDHLKDYDKLTIVNINQLYNDDFIKEICEEDEYLDFDILKKHLKPGGLSFINSVRGKVIKPSQRLYDLALEYDFFTPLLYIPTFGKYIEFNTQIDEFNKFDVVGENPGSLLFFKHFGAPYPSFDFKPYPMDLLTRTLQVYHREICFDKRYKWYDTIKGPVSSESHLYDKHLEEFYFDTSDPEGWNKRVASKSYTKRFGIRRDET